jgi:hypothetical protein
VDENLWVKHYLEFSGHAGLLEGSMVAFACGLPKSAPEVGDFDVHSELLGASLTEIHEFLESSVGPAYDKVEASIPSIGTESAEMPPEEAPMVTAAAGGGSGLGGNEDRKGKRKMG